MVYLKQVEHPNIFFKYYEVDHKHDGYNYYILCDENGKMLRKQLYSYRENESNSETPDRVILYKIVEKRFSQSIIDSCTRDPYGNKRKRTEKDNWHLVRYRTVIDKETGDEIYSIENDFSDYMYLYDNIIYAVDNHNCTLLDKDGNILFEGSSSNVNVGKKSIICQSNSYSSNEKEFEVFDRKLATLIAKY